MKFAFVTNIAGVSPETYSAVYETAGSYNLIVGVDGVEAGKEYVKKLAEEGFELVNLCGDFGDEAAAEMREMVGDAMEIKNVSYSLDEMLKLNRLESFKNYGIIILDEDAEKGHEVVLRSETCDARVIFVKDLREARNAGRRLIEKRIDFIELCSWFDRLRMDSIVEATGNEVPVGTCGELDLGKITD